MWLVVFYYRSVILNYLMPNLVYTYILIYVVGWLVVFYDRSVILNYLMPNPVYTYLSHMMIYN